VLGTYAAEPGRQMWNFPNTRRATQLTFHFSLTRMAKHLHYTGRLCLGPGQSVSAVSAPVEL
jgi:hypothetical protein